MEYYHPFDFFQLLKNVKNNFSLWIIQKQVQATFGLESVVWQPLF